MSMSVCKTKQVVESYNCDYCGKEFWKRQECSLVFRAEEDITFEYWTHGDYCPECLVKLANGITRAIPVAERYDKDETKIPKELAVIAAEIEREVGA